MSNTSSITSIVTPLGATHLGHHHTHPQHHSHPESHPLSQLRGLLTQRQEETPVWTSFHLTPRHWPRTDKWTFSSLSWDITIGTLQTTVTGQSQGPKENYHPQVISFKTIWLISSPSYVYDLKWVISRPSETHTVVNNRPTWIQS